MEERSISKSVTLDITAAAAASDLALPLAATPISAGFPSPAEDCLELKLDLNRELVRHPNATFYGRVKGCSMIDAGIADGDILVIDKSLEPRDGDTAVCFLDGEFTVKRISRKADGLYLIPANHEFQPIRIGEDRDFQVWGIVTYVIHKCRSWRA